jgi:hypothetical protein
MEKEIKLNKRKSVRAMMISLVFVALGIYILVIADTQSAVASIGAMAIGIAAIVFFGTGAIIVFIKLFDNTPGIIINEEGINIVKEHLIRWEDITDYSTAMLRNKKLLLIYVENPEEYMSTATTLRRMAMKLTINQYKTPFGLIADRYQCSFEELKAAVLEGMKQAALAKRKKP